jgi:hypothetical protein
VVGRSGGRRSAQVLVELPLKKFHTITDVAADFDLVQHHLVAGTREKLLAALAPNDLIARHALAQYVLGECRGVSIYSDAGLPEWWPPGIRALAHELRHRFDLSKQLHKQPSAGGFLWGLWLNLGHQAFDESDRDAVIKIVTAMLRARGVDVAPMEAELEREKSELYAMLRRDDVVSRQKQKVKIVESTRDNRKRRKGRKQP